MGEAILCQYMAALLSQVISTIRCESQKFAIFSIPYPLAFIQAE